MSLERAGAASGVLAVIGPFVYATLQALGLHLSPSELWFSLAVEAILIVLVVVWFIAPAMQRKRKSQMTVKDSGPEQPRVGDIHGKNVSVNQSGGITGDVHIGAPKRTLSAAGSSLTMLEHSLQKLGDRTIGLTAVMGNAESYDFGVQIGALAERVGWTLEPAGVSQAIFSKPLKGVDISVPASRQEDVDPAMMIFGRWLADNRLGPVAIGMNSGQPHAEILIGAID